jgi:archaellum component FlaF (FlaF/FlaG flagellin family)
VYQPFANQFTFIDATGFQSMSAGEYVVDSKAKRILEPDESVAVVIETQSDSEGLSVMYQGRILTQLRGTR